MRRDLGRERDMLGRWEMCDLKWDFWYTERKTQGNLIARWACANASETERDENSHTLTTRCLILGLERPSYLRLSYSVFLNSWRLRD